MFRKFITLKWLSLPLLTAFIAITGLGAAKTVPAQPIEAYPHASLSGLWYPRVYKGQVNSYDYSSGLSIPGPEDDKAGGAASFGWFDSGEVLLLSHAEYLPSVQGARTKRSLTPSSRIELKELPRYIMVCAWVTEDGQPDGAHFVGFAERDDANAKDEYKSFTKYHALYANWVKIPPKRAESKFADRDYCKEIAQTKASPVAKWLPRKKKK